MATILKGIASTESVDAERMSIVAGSFELNTSVDLLWKHAGNSVGRILSLTRDGERTIATVICDDDDLAVNRRAKMTPDRRPILTPS